MQHANSCADVWSSRLYLIAPNFKAVSNLVQLNEFVGPHLVINPALHNISTDLQVKTAQRELEVLIQQSHIKCSLTLAAAFTDLAVELHVWA